MANFKPVGSRPMAKQKRITCMTGNAKMNNITPTFRHIRKKFFCNKARIFPLDVNWIWMIWINKQTSDGINNEQWTHLNNEEDWTTTVWLYLPGNIQTDQLLIYHHIRFHHFGIQLGLHLSKIETNVNIIEITGHLLLCAGHVHKLYSSIPEPLIKRHFIHYIGQKREDNLVDLFFTWFWLLLLCAIIWMLLLFRS